MQSARSHAPASAARRPPARDRRCRSPLETARAARRAVSPREEEPPRRTSATDLDLVATRREKRRPTRGLHLLRHSNGKSPLKESRTSSGRLRSSRAEQPKFRAGDSASIVKACLDDSLHRRNVGVQWVSKGKSAVPNF